MNSEVTLRIECLMPERLINRAMALDARFSELRRVDALTLVVCCDAASAAILSSICDRFAIPVEVVSRRGVNALARFARRRATLGIGLAVFFALCWLFLGHVWIVDVSFTGQAAEHGRRASLEDSLANAGIRPGMSRDIDTVLLAQSIRADAGDYSFVGVHLQGVRLLIEAVPEVPAPPLYKVEAARDLVSDRDGIVISAIARSGKLCVQPGDAVRRGQLLIQGEELSADGQTQPIAALGEVIVRTWYEGEAALPLYRQYAEDTGRSSVSSHLRLFEFDLPIDGDSGFRTQRVETDRLALGGLYLPLTLDRSTFWEQSVTTVAADTDELQALLEPLARAEAAMRLSEDSAQDHEIARSWIDYTTTGGHMRAKAVYEIHVNAAVTRDALYEEASVDANGKIQGG